jgi:hypothetical protein
MNEHQKFLIDNRIIDIFTDIEEIEKDSDEAMRYLVAEVYRLCYEYSNCNDFFTYKFKKKPDEIR